MRTALLQLRDLHVPDTNHTPFSEDSNPLEGLTGTFEVQVLDGRLKVPLVFSFTPWQEHAVLELTDSPEIAREWVCRLSPAKREQLETMLAREADEVLDTLVANDA
jgi:hypothetical protein